MKGSKNNLNSFILRLETISNNNQHLVGGKAANIGKLTKMDINYPSGFCITTSAFDLYLNNSGVQDKILAILKDKSKSNESAALEIKSLLWEAKIPSKIKIGIVQAYKRLQNQESKEIPLAVRSSATLEDLRSASFAGQFDSFLGIVDEKGLIKSVKKCWDSLFNARSIAYTRQKHIKIARLKMGVIVQRLIMAKAAGVMFTIHPVTLEKNHILIESSFGLGNQLVLGKISPDTFILAKDTLEVIQRNIVRKETCVEFNPETKKLIERKLVLRLQNEPSLKEQELKELGRIGRKIENTFNCPQDIEWAMENGKIFVIQTRPITTI